MNLFEQSLFVADALQEAGELPLFIFREGGQQRSLMFTRNVVPRSAALARISGWCPWQISEAQSDTSLVLIR